MRERVSDRFATFVASREAVFANAVRGSSAFRFGLAMEDRFGLALQDRIGSSAARGLETTMTNAVRRARPTPGEGPAPANSPRGRPDDSIAPDDGEAAKQETAGSRVRFADEELRAAIVGATSEAFAVSYLDPADWNAAARILSPRTGVAKSRLGEIGHLLATLNVTLGEPARSLTAPTIPATAASRRTQE